MKWFLNFRRWLAGVIAPPDLSTVDEDYDPSEDPATWLSLDYVHDQLAEQLKQQWDVWDTMDGRLRLILGVIGIVFAAAFGFQRGQTPINAWVAILTVSAVALYLIAATIVAFAYWPQKFDWPPRPDGLRELITTRPEDTKLEVIDSIIESYNLNEQVLKKKTRCFKWAFAMAAVATLGLGIAIGIHILTQAPDLPFYIPSPTPTPTVTTTPTPLPTGGTP